MSYVWYNSDYILWKRCLWRHFLRIGMGKESRESEMVPTWFKINSASYNEPTWVSGKMSSVTRHNWLNTYVIGRRFERKLQKRLKHPSKKWCTLDFQYSLTTVNVHGFPGEMSSVTRHNWLNTYVIDRRFERKLQKRLKHPGKKWCTLEFQYSPLTTVNVHGFLGKCRVWLAITG